VNELFWQNTNKEIIQQYPDIVELVWQQVLKDFSMEALPIEDTPIVTLDDVFNAVYPHVTHYIKNDFSSLMRLLYRIDISEKSVQRQMDLMPDDTALAISTLIVKREIQKVVLRKQYSA